eukprot:CAMPEP_0118946780 /NCGR_PEP_ID=MMETSP1169-20130426/44826_1 /TAXON_ID=36882 /ORGANISM="Pyramimonas obovata, Strain CCMP722" /LENGTH=47 /DNA_ID= /DNA_START= /DNA_END= /DNA_ORIENTATION=
MSSVNHNFARGTSSKSKWLSLNTIRTTSSMRATGVMVRASVTEAGTS